MILVPVTTHNDISAKVSHYCNPTGAEIINDVLYHCATITHSLALQLNVYTYSRSSGTYMLYTQQEGAGVYCIGATSLLRVVAQQQIS